MSAPPVTMLLADVGTYAVTSVIGLAAGVLGAFLKDVLGAHMRTDQELRDLRTPLYKDLWKLTEALPKWPPAELTYADLRRLTEHLKTWYFEQGGIYLSRPSYKAYSAVQDALSKELEGATAEKKVPPPVYESIRMKCSALRREMTDDLLSRRSGSRILA